jgi:hypothetical protein
LVREQRVDVRRVDCGERLRNHRINCSNRITLSRRLVPAS